MGLQVVPPLVEPYEQALLRALASAGVRLDSAAAGYMSPWRLAGTREAVEGLPSHSYYALSPRSTRGATRA